MTAPHITVGRCSPMAILFRRSCSVPSRHCFARRRKWWEPVEQMPVCMPV